MKDNNFNLFTYCDKDYYIKDPIHKEINFKSDKWILDLISTKEFKRLKYIFQLGVSFKVFPSATNNRYMHSIGTFQVALKFVNSFFNKISVAQRKLFLASALLHDIGHGPFSHVFEKITNVSHEEMTKKIILNKDTEINKALIKNKINPHEIIDVIDGQSKHEWINKLISSNIDVDRIDYILRDSYFIGTNYSTIDIDFLIERSHLLDNDIYFSQSTINVIESFLLGRYYMHQDIYDNKNTYIYEWSLVNIFKRLREIKNDFQKNCKEIYYYDLYKNIILMQEEVSVEIYTKFTDTNFTSFLESLKVIDDKILNSFLDSFLNQNGVIALDYSKKNEVIKELKKVGKNYNISYLYSEVTKSKKKIYLDDEKYQINIIDVKTNKLYKFNSFKFQAFESNKSENKDKIILVNKNLII